jgi:phosphoribosylanthranilate isomerase
MVGRRDDCRVRVSVCACRSAADITACVAGGVDAIGVLVGVKHRAEDAITVESAKDLLGQVPPYIERYVVTHLSDPDEIVLLVEGLPVDAVQLQDEIDPAIVTTLRSRLPKLGIKPSPYVPTTSLIFNSPAFVAT